MQEINVRPASARNGAVGADERDSKNGIFIRQVVTADVIAIRRVEIEVKGSCIEFMRRFLSLWKIKFSQGSVLSAIKIAALRNDVVTPAIYVG
jgi:hypothetical protein